MYKNPDIRRDWKEYNKKSKIIILFDLRKVTESWGEKNILEKRKQQGDLEKGEQVF